MTTHLPDGPSVTPTSTLPGLAWPAIASPAARPLLSTLFQLDYSQWWREDELLSHQFRQARRLVAHAIEQVPHYRDHLGHCGLDSAGSLCPESFRRWPVLKKRQIQANPDLFLSKAMPHGHGEFRAAATSGSSGQPLRVAVSDLAISFQQALILRFQLWNQLDHRLKFAAIKGATQEAAMPSWGPPAGLIFDTGPSVTQSAFADHRVQLDWLIREAPAYLLAHNTNLSALLHLSRNTGRAPRGLKLALGFSDMAANDTARLALELWGAHFVDTYSCNEIGTLALQCPVGNALHVQSEHVILEVLRPDGTPCETGEQGRVVVTDLHNFAMPLIRYELGDMAIRGEPCACGRGLPVLERIVGRSGKLAIDPTGRTFYPMLNFGFWISAAPILQWQIAQLASDKLEVRYVAERDLTASEIHQLTTEIRQAMRFDYQIAFSRVTRIAHGPGGKFEDFVPIGKAAASR